jgi:polar amino acid transport system substrate-binding protein
VRRIAAVVALIAAVGPIVDGQDDATRRQLIPSGKLRVGINRGNELTRAVGAEISRELARRLQTEAVLIEYPTPGAVIDAVGTEWDIAFVAADPDRESQTAFTPPYVHIDVTYLVRADSPIRAAADADRRGVRIATGATSAYTLFLRRELKGSELVLLNYTDGAKALAAGSVDAVAGLRFQLLQIAPQVSGSRILADNFTRAPQAIAVPRSRTAALAYLTSVVGELTRSGFVGAAIKRIGLPGASVAIANQ